MADFKFTDNSKYFKDALVDKLPPALEAIGLTAEGYAKKKCAVDTGLLRNSITHAVSGHSAAISNYHASKGSNRSKKTGKRISASSANAGSVGFGTYSGTIGSEDENAVYIGTNVEYAAYVEMGTVKSKAQPFLKPAIVDHISTYKKLVEQYLKGD